MTTGSKDRRLFVGVANLTEFLLAYITVLTHKCCLPASHVRHQGLNISYFLLWNFFVYTRKKGNAWHTNQNHAELISVTNQNNNTRSVIFQIINPRQRLSTSKQSPSIAYYTWIYILYHNIKSFSIQLLSFRVKTVKLWNYIFCAWLKNRFDTQPQCLAYNTDNDLMT